MLHPDTRLQFIDEDIGYGIFATNFIPAGTITYVKDALEIELDAEHELVTSSVYNSQIKKYAYREASGKHVIGWDLSKYMNHSCSPNTLSTGYGFEIAVRDIEPGEHITDDYGMLNIETAMLCACRQPDCRWEVQPDDMDYMWQQWDDKVRTALDILLEVPQPLLELLDAETYRSTMLYLNTGQNYQSVKVLQYCPPLVQAGNQHC
jgi:hypothetical protein